MIFSSFVSIGVGRYDAYSQHGNWKSRVSYSFVILLSASNGV
jgi:hypothetical protein